MAARMASRVLTALGRGGDAGGRVLLRPAALPARRLHRPFSGASPSDDDLYEKTTVTMLQRDSPNMMFVDSYGLHGFTVNGNRVIGPCAIIPNAIVQWNVGSWKDINEESLSLFYLLEPRIEILVLGVGDRVERLDPELLRFMRRQRVAVEVQDTGHACSTFNFLISDRRLVAAGLIPPTQLH